MITKLSRLRAAADAGDWAGALRIASKFGDLGPQKTAILRAWEALQRPEFQRQLGRDPEALLEAGRAALRERYRL